MKKRMLKKLGIFSTAAFALALMGQVDYAQSAIDVNVRLPRTGSVNTHGVMKTNKDNDADFNVTRMGWGGSGIDWWLMYKEIRCTGVGNFNKTGFYKVYYNIDGRLYQGSVLYATIKTDANTWHACDIEGQIYP